jgi:hypothetical protein
LSSNVSGIPAAPASTQHLIEFTAFTPDGDEIAGVATVTETDGKIPFSELAKIPGFRSGDVIDHRDGEQRPLLLGPGTDVPGHPAWCRTHDNACGDGQSVCLGEFFSVDGDGDGDAEDMGAGLLRAGIVSSASEGMRISVDLDNENAVSLSAARGFALLLLSLVEAAEAGSAVSR